MSKGWSSTTNFVAFSFENGMLFLLADAVIYILLYFYLDQVLPNEFGT
jgi:hypothetical protein